MRENKVKSVRVRLTEDDFKEFNKKAHKKGLTVSDMIRMSVLGEKK